MTVRIPIDKQLRVSSLLFTPDLKTKILLLTSEILKTKSHLLKSNTLFVPRYENTRPFILTKLCAVLHGQMIKNLCVHNLRLYIKHSSYEIILLLLTIHRNSNNQDSIEIKENIVMFTCALHILLYSKCRILTVQNPKETIQSQKLYTSPPTLCKVYPEKQLKDIKIILILLHLRK